MGTRSSIHVIRPDGSTRGIYCHWDGYPSGVGKTLCENFDSDELASELIALGDCSSVCDAKCLGEVVAYHRDKDEPWDDVKPTKSDCVRDAVTIYSNAWCEYHYFRPVGGSWLMYVDGGLVPIDYVGLDDDE